MSASLKIAPDHLALARTTAASLRFHPHGTVRCRGLPLFRTKAARELGCLLDLDPAVNEWSCLPLALGRGEDSHIPDFIVIREEGACLVDAALATGDHQERWIEKAAAEAGYRYEVRPTIEAGHRLPNSIDLLRYAHWQCALGDRIRVLAVLDDHGSLTVAECLSAFHETTPIAGLSSLVLNRFVEIDLDEARIEPETLVRRFRA